MIVEGFFLSAFISLLLNALTTYASKLDDDHKAEIEKIRKKIDDREFISTSIISSLKKISADSKESDAFKVLVSNDAISERIASLINPNLSEDSFVSKVIDEIKIHGNIPEPIYAKYEHVINQFVTDFYNSIIKNPAYAPYLILHKISDEHKKTRRTLKEESLDIKKHISNLFESQQTRESCGVESFTKEVAPSMPQSSIATEYYPLASEFILKRTDDALRKLNELFKEQAVQVREIQKKRDYKKAIDLYQSLLIKADDSVDKITVYGIYIDCALCSINLGDYTGANEWLIKAEDLNVNDEKVLTIRSLYYYENNQPEKARDLANKALEANPKYHIALNLITALSLDEGKSGAYILKNYFMKNGSDLLEFKSEHLSLIYRTIGQCYLHDGMLDEAIASFKESLEIDDNDDGCLSLLGISYFRKAVGVDTEVIRIHEELSEEQRTLLLLAVENLEKAIQLAPLYSNKRNLANTISNLTNCYIILGDYNKAYDLTGTTVKSIEDLDEVIRSKATAAFYSELYGESSNLISKLSNKTAQDIINTAVSHLRLNEKQEALDVITNYLSNPEINPADVSSLRSLRFQVLILLGNSDDAKTELNILLNSNVPSWDKHAMQGSYYSLVGKREEADKEFQLALRDKAISFPAKLFIAHYYFRSNLYAKCLDICKTIEFSNVGGEIDFTEFYRMAIICSYETGNYSDSKEYINKAREYGIKSDYIYEIHAAIAWKEEDYIVAKDNFIMLFEISENVVRKLNALANVINVLTMLHDFDSIRKYHMIASKLDGFLMNSRLIINLIIAYIILGNTYEAKSIFEESLGASFDDKDSDLHKFAPYFYLRQDKADLFARYAEEFNKRHGDTQWLWKKSLSEDEEELRNTIINAANKANKVKFLYQQHRLPFISIPRLLGKREIVHHWRFRQDYNITLHVETGNPDDLSKEIKTVKKQKAILVDYLTLLEITEAHPEALWMLNSIFDDIYICRSTHTRLIEELVTEEHKVIRDILEFLSKCNKIKFIRANEIKSNLSFLEGTDRMLDEEHMQLLNYAKDNKVCLFSIDSRFRIFANVHEVQNFGSRALFETAKESKIIDEEELYSFIISMGKRNNLFISFDHKVLSYLFKKFTLDEASSIFRKLSSHMLLPSSTIETFINVYREFLGILLSSEQNVNLAKHIIMLTLSDLRRLTVKSIIKPKLDVLFGYKSKTEIDMVAINTHCIVYLNTILETIFASPLTKEIKNDLFYYVLNEFNLAHWHNIMDGKALAINTAILHAKENSNSGAT